MFEVEIDCGKTGKTFALHQLYIQVYFLSEARKHYFNTPYFGSSRCKNGQKCYIIVTASTDQVGCGLYFHFLDTRTKQTEFTDRSELTDGYQLTVTTKTSMPKMRFNLGIFCLVVSILTSIQAVDFHRLLIKEQKIYNMKE